jgi:hypothetical protein
MTPERRENDSVFIELQRQSMEALLDVKKDISEIKVQIASIVIPSRPCQDFLLHEKGHHEEPCESLKIHLAQAETIRQERRSLLASIFGDTVSALIVGAGKVVFILLLAGAVATAHSYVQKLPDQKAIQKEIKVNK